MFCDAMALARFLLLLNRQAALHLLTDAELDEVTSSVFR
jgi:hypothetical protein